MIRILLFQLAAALELGLVIVEGVAPDAVSFLPLGGSHLTQVGVILVYVRSYLNVLKSSVLSIVD